MIIEFNNRETFIDLDSMDGLDAMIYLSVPFLFNLYVSSLWIG